LSLKAASDFELRESISLFEESVGGKGGVRFWREGQTHLIVQPFNVHMEQ